MKAVRLWSVRNARSVEALSNTAFGAMKLLSPLLRRIPRHALETAVMPIERLLKKTFFDCQMCGRCDLIRTGISCPMNCPKTLRNGPCGGIMADGGCEVLPQMRCVWLDAWDGADRMKDQRAITNIQRPLAQRARGHSTWTAVMRDELIDANWVEPVPSESPATARKPASGLERLLQGGAFTVTTEFNPPDEADAQAIIAHAAPLTAVCDAVNVTDNAGASVHISSMSVSALLAFDSFEPVMQIACRDRNRLAIQADAMGAAALGIRNMLCMSGDAITHGDHPDGKPVFDLDAVTLLKTLRHMRDEGAYLSGKALKVAPAFYLGATANPLAMSTEIEIKRLTKKIDAGAQFLQTQYCFDLDGLTTFLDRYRAEGLHERCHLLVGIGPLNSARSARWMRNTIPGVRIPDALIARLEVADDPRAEGRRIVVEMIKQFKEMPGISGAHVMAIGKPKITADIIKAAGVGPAFRKTARANEWVI